MLGPEQAGLPARFNSVYLEGKPLQLETVVARQLGLRDGQIVQASAELRGDTIKILLNGRFFDLPPGMRFRPGDTIWLRAHATLNNWILKPVDLPASKNTSPIAAPLALPLGSPSDAINFNRLSALLLRPPMSPALMELFQPAAINALLQTTGNPELAILFQRLALSMRGLSAASLQRGVQGSGMWLEALLSQGQAVSGQDSKSWLRRMIRALGDNDSPQKADLERALDDVEAAQVDSLAAQARGEISFAMVLPFADANPVEVKFFRPARRPGQEAPPFTVNIHTDNQYLGEIWLKTSISRASHVDLMMWALRPDIFNLARLHSDALSRRLREAGLTMESFRVFNSARPSLPESWTPTGAVLDVKA
jgi:hypothetical protein